MQTFFSFLAIFLPFVCSEITEIPTSMPTSMPTESVINVTPHPTSNPTTTPEENVDPSLEAQVYEIFFYVLFSLFVSTGSFLFAKIAKKKYKEHLIRSSIEIAIRNGNKI